MPASRHMHGLGHDSGCGFDANVTGLIIYHTDNSPFGGFSGINFVTSLKNCC